MFDEPNFQDFPLRFEPPGAGHSHYSCDRCLEFFVGIQLGLDPNRFFSLRIVIEHYLEFFSFEFGGRRRG